MSNLPGVFSAVAPGKTTQFSVLNPVYQIGRHVMTVVANQGYLLQFDTATPLGVKLAVAGTTRLAGINGDATYDPAAFPDPDLANNIFAQSFLKWRAVGLPITVWKKGEFRVIPVSGSVNYGSFIIPDTVGGKDGYFKDNVAVNPFLNGSVVCLQANTASGLPIVVELECT